MTRFEKVFICVTIALLVFSYPLLAFIPLVMYGLYLIDTNGDDDDDDDDDD